MSEFAQFVAFHQAGPVILPDPDTGQHEAHIRHLNFPNLDTGRTAILLHKMAMDGAVEHWEMRFNDHEPFAVFDHLPSGLWPPWLSQHQIIQGDNLKASDNELVIVVDGRANVQTLRFVLFYHAAAPECEPKIEHAM